MYTEIIRDIQKDKLSPLSMKDSTASHLYGFYQACKELGLEYEKHKNHFLIKSPYNDSYIGGVSGMVSSFVSSFALRVCGDKELTHKILAANDIQVPKQYSFSKNDLDGAIECFKKYNLTVVKPSDGSGGKGITIGVNGIDEFKKAFQYAVENTGQNGRVLVEEKIDGFDIRVIVVNGKFDCAICRIPAHVIGDGVKTVAQLVSEKNEARSKHPHHKAFPIIIKPSLDERIVPHEGEILFLSSAANIHQGGEALDVTEYVGNDIRNLSIKVAKSVRGLNVVGIDFYLKDFKDPTAAYVLELNTAANFSIHYFPYYGKKRNPALAIVKDMLAM
ncbi:ATP-grasp domain-containing protein [Acinetobacter equi]|uniref:ATP-grasp domain-containing protein n=1 Tax=Acinetobacter equi TaxID=1324350 RepID=A0A0N9WE52_9GAMM|nr:ATP-grasp domain-containing protein [Acinetobacter equi]ALH95601.1 hypothetical protein AOY20_08725 [Acinetobacter equi]